jgi:CheY-like chemotaxis protein
MARLLVVDDSVDTTRALGRLLALHGHMVDVANSGEAALGFVDASVPDLVILDLMMPGIDGSEVLRRMREDPRTRRVPVVIFSAVGDPAVRDHLIAKGAQGFWTKGAFDFKQLAPEVDRLIAAGTA